MHPIRQALEYAAAALGFSGVGVADAHTPQGDKLAQFIADGKHADMSWMERHLPARQNPELVLPGVKRVIMLSYEYPRSSARTAAGSIARYAQGEDYHKLLAGKLADLDETLQFYGGVQRCFTDSGPVSERFFAEQAGLGWIGRHGLLIRPGRGSYCFLASILTTLEIPTDTPQPNRCGNCHRCEQACPTGALHNGCCDARRCLAYWTIEAKTPAPPEIAALQGSALYGCDLCQEACPWNRPRAEEQIDPHLLMPAGLKPLPPARLAAMESDDFNSFFQGSPIRRIGSDHLRRNIENGHF
jgi:epoxyqueuosine reductase